MNKRAPSVVLASLAAAYLTLAPPSAQAVLKTWSYVSGSSDWTNAANWSGGTVPAALDDVVIDGAAVELTSDTPDLNSLLVTNGATLSVYSPMTNGTTAWGLLVTVTGLLTVADNSWVNPYSHPTNGGSAWFQCSNLVVDATSGFDANYRGYAGATNVPNFQDGYGPGSTAGSSLGAGGAGYGGQGGLGTGNAGGGAYGSYTNPVDPGSGAGGSYSSQQAGAGGGLIRVLATDSVLVDGSLLANGKGVLNWYSGPGSGGGIYVGCRTFEGSGLLSAVGGDVNRMDTKMPGGGGGGRIAVVYDTGAQAGVSSQPTVRLNAAGGNQIAASKTVATARLRRGHPGTVYLPDAQFFDLGNVLGGVIRVPGLTAWSCDSLAISNGLVGVPPGFSLTVTNDVTLSDAGGIDLSNSVVNIGGSLLLDSDGRSSAFFRGGALQQISVGADVSLSKGWIEIDAQGATDRTVPIAGDLTSTNGALAYLYAGMTNGSVVTGLLVDVEGDITIAPSSWIYPYSHPTNGGSVHFQAANIAVSGGAGIDASEKGFRGGEQDEWGGFGPGGGQGANSPTRGAGGGGYGGEGADGNNFPGGPTYGSTEHPVDPGSGGGHVKQNSDPKYQGSDGGGLIHVTVADSVLVDGSLLADGGNVANYPGCGSGGGIYVMCKTFGGSGLLKADGGSSGRNALDRSGSGGGGRIAIYYTLSTNGWAGTAQANGGVGAYAGNIGTNGTVTWLLNGVLPNDPPTVSITLPLPGATFVAPANITINATASDSDGTVTNVDFYQGVTLIGSDTNEPYSVLWSGAPVGNYDLKAVATDDDGDSTASSLVNINVTATPGITNIWNFPAGGNWAEGVKWSLGYAPTNGQLAIITNANVTLTNDTADLGGLVVSNNANLYVYSPATNGATPWGLLVSVSGQVSVVASSWVHPYSHPTNGGSVWFRCSNIVVDATSGFDANEKGYAGGTNTANAQPGYGPGGTAGVLSGTGGAGYGGGGGPGYGSSAGGAYGSYTNPVDPGSGGGRSYTSVSYAPGPGGGLIRLLASDSIIMDGSLLANGGGVGNQYSGPGSGGGIYVQCRTFEGSGLLSAAGGDVDRMDTKMPGGGGGGRIAVVYDTAAQVGVSPHPTVRLNAAGGNQINAAKTVTTARLRRGHSGTVYLSDDQFFDLGNVLGGVIRVPGFTAWSGDSLAVSNGMVGLPSGFTLTVTNDLTLGAAGGIDLSNSVASIGGDLIIDSDGRSGAFFRGGTLQQISVDGDLSLSKGWIEIDGQGAADRIVCVGGNVTSTNGALAYLYGGMTNGSVTTGLLVDVVGDITIATNGWVYPYSHPTNGGSVHLQAANLTVSVGGGIDATAKGYRGGYQAEWGYGPGGTVGTTGRRPGGAGYGGEGTATTLHTGGPTYGSAERPVNPGSGAGGVRAYNSSRDYGSTGGGLIHVAATDAVLVDGSLLASGGDLLNEYPGCGSGGGIYVHCRTFAGSGLLKADGGKNDRNAADYGGSGGGGRIAVSYIKSTNDWHGAAQANGGVGVYAGNTGADGTVVWVFDPPPGGTVILVR